MRGDGDGGSGELEERIGVVVCRGAEIVVLRDDDVATDGDGREVVDLGVDAERRALPHGEFPGHPDLHPSIDEARGADLCAEETEQNDA